MVRKSGLALALTLLHEAQKSLDWGGFHKKRRVAYILMSSLLRVLVNSSAIGTVRALRRDGELKVTLPMRPVLDAVSTNWQVTRGSFAPF